MVGALLPPAEAFGLLSIIFADAFPLPAVEPLPAFGGTTTWGLLFAGPAASPAFVWLDANGLFKKRLFMPGAAAAETAPPLPDDASLALPLPADLPLSLALSCGGALDFAVSSTTSSTSSAFSSSPSPCSFSASSGSSTSWGSSSSSTACTSSSSSSGLSAAAVASASSSSSSASISSPSSLPSARNRMRHFSPPRPLRSV
mmetsp:Transcript_25300/g.69574  ORF Transcript_25300/g.69574 Transcript_25300/m.69574 type:complete len:201 (+) Transcript_25300:305-907(+)